MAEYEKKVREIMKAHGCYFVCRDRGDYDILMHQESNSVLMDSLSN